MQSEGGSNRYTFVCALTLVAFARVVARTDSSLLESRLILRLSQPFSNFPQSFSVQKAPFSAARAFFKLFLRHKNERAFSSMLLMNSMKLVIPLHLIVLVNSHQR